MAKVNKEKAIANLMDILKCSQEEAEEIFGYDNAVDHDEKTPHDLTPEQQKTAQKMARTGTRKAPTTYNFPQKEKKENATKSGIIAEIAQILTEKSQFSVENLVITNKERQISFEIGGEKYEITLVQKRKPKN